jgi:hypothetical protein
VDRELGALKGRQDNHFEEVASAIRPDSQPAVGVFSSIFDGERMADGVMDVLVGDTVLGAEW